MSGIEEELLSIEELPLGGTNCVIGLIISGPNYSQAHWKSRLRFNKYLTASASGMLSIS